MADKQLELKILTPTKEVFSGIIKYLLINTSNGQKGILSGHENCVEIIKEGDFKVSTQNQELIFSSAGGTLFLENNKMKIISEFAEFAENYEAMLKERVEELSRRYSEEIKSEADLQRIKIALRRSLIKKN